MKNSVSLFILSFLLIYSCSTEEDTAVQTPNIVQTPDPEPVAETPTITQYTLTISAAEGGTVSSEGGTYDEGTEVTITATANEGYRFDGWEGYESYESTIIINLDSDFILTPIFVEDKKPPNNFAVDEFWGKIVDFNSEFFFAENISEFNRSGILNSNKIITDYFGNYGPTEWWITSPSTSTDDIHKLREKFCQRRLERNENWTNPNANNPNYDACMSHGWFEYPDNYLANGSYVFGYNIIALGQYGDDNSYRNFDFPIQLHEYFHIVQANSILTMPNEGGMWGWDMFSFFKEGSARFYQKYVWRKLSNDVFIDLNPDYNFQDISMREEFRIIMESLKEGCSTFTDYYRIDYSDRNICDPYGLGAWGVAFLMNKKGDGDYDSYWKSFYPVLKVKMITNDNDITLSFSQAMKEFYGLTIEEFNQEFKLFLQLPIEQQLEIIPDI